LRIVSLVHRVRCVREIVMSLLPDKYSPIEFSSVGLAALLLETLQTNDTVTTLWDRVSTDRRVRSFNRFADALTVLYAANLIEMVRGALRRASQSGGQHDSSDMV
jgi:hypothetical protein